MSSTSTPDQTNGVIESIVQLTEQRDRFSIEQSLLSTLYGMVDHVDGWIIDIPPLVTSKDDCMVLHGDQERLPDSLLEQAYQPFEDIVVPRQIAVDGHTFLIAKLVDTPHGGRNMLILSKQKWSNGDLQMVKGMVQVYQNFVTILYDSEKDTLTGLYNRRRLEIKLNELISPSVRERRRSGGGGEDFLAILDLDKFKRINDTFGHLIGDEVLLTFSNIMRRTLRDNDMLFRYGGEEFMVLLRDISRESTAMALERLRRNVEEHAFPQVGQVTVSIGYARLDRNALPIQTIENADKALYYAKDNGRNQVHSYERLVSENKLANTHQEGSIELF